MFSALLTSLQTITAVRPLRCLPQKNPCKMQAIPDSSYALPITLVLVLQSHLLELSVIPIITFALSTLKDIFISMVRSLLGIDLFS